MKFLLLIALVLSQLFFLSQEAGAKDEKISLQDIITNVNFKVLNPTTFPDDMEMYIKPYPPTGYGKPTKFTMIFTKNKQFVFSIQESKSKEKELGKDVYSYGQLVFINGNRGYFLTSGIKGGHLLIWIQNGTFVEMDGTLSKEKMLEIAKSMK